MELLDNFPYFFFIFMASLISRVDPGVCGYRPEQAEETLENVTKIVVSLN